MIDHQEAIFVLPAVQVMRLEMEQSVVESLAVGLESHHEAALGMEVLGVGMVIAQGYTGFVEGVVER